MPSAKSRIVLYTGRSFCAIATKLDKHSHLPLHRMKPNFLYVKNVLSQFNAILCDTAHLKNLMVNFKKAQNCQIVKQLS